MGEVVGFFAEVVGVRCGKGLGLGVPEGGPLPGLDLGFEV